MVQYIFVTFKHSETNDNLYIYFKKKKSFIGRFFQIMRDICCNRMKRSTTEEQNTLFLLGYPISIEPADEPDQILWQNHFYK